METVNDKAVVFLPWNAIEPEAQQQILNTASMPFVFKHVAACPTATTERARQSGPFLRPKELAEDGDGAVWLTLHSGSRRVGNKIGSHYINVAQQLCASMGVRLPDRDLAYLPPEHPAFAAYLRDLNWAQQFALHNRNEMMTARRRR